MSDTKMSPKEWLAENFRSSVASGELCFTIYEAASVMEAYMRYCAAAQPSQRALTLAESDVVDLLRNRVAWKYQCLGFPQCDGDLPGEAHTRECPCNGTFGPPTPPLIDIRGTLNLIERLLAGKESV